MRSATYYFTKRGVGWLALGALACLLGCRSPLKARGDAGARNDASVIDRFAMDALPDQAGPDVGPDVPPDLAKNDIAVRDVADGDVGTNDAPPRDLGVPHGFRFENHTSQTAYVRTDGAIGCRMRGASGWQDCSFFDLWCLPHCGDVRSGESCCYQCEQPLPALYAIPPGGTRTLAWTGTIFTRATGLCSDCECQQEMPVPDGQFEASARVYADYECSPSTCQLGSDGIVAMAYPRGAYTTYATTYGVPNPDDYIIIYIAPVPNTITDAGVAADTAASSDSSSADTPFLREASSDLLPASFAELPGYSFQILASATAPDASTSWGTACIPPNPDAGYTLYFSGDGSAVKLTNLSADSDFVIPGTLVEASEEGLSYVLDSIAGGELLVFVDPAGRLAARAIVYASGLLEGWCIEAPMKRVEP